LQPRNLEKTVGDACTRSSVVLLKYKSNEKTTHKKKSDALARKTCIGWVSYASSSNFLVTMTAATAAHVVVASVR